MEKNPSLAVSRIEPRIASTSPVTERSPASGKCVSPHPRCTMMASSVSV
jgi:hypothetical protein